MNITPGPWKCDVRVGCVAVYPANEHYVCLDGLVGRMLHFKMGEKKGTGHWVIAEESIANARAFSVIPELLEAFGQALVLLRRDPAACWDKAQDLHERAECIAKMEELWVRVGGAE